jgi:hypothetical protein
MQVSAKILSGRSFVFILQKIERTIRIHFHKNLKTFFILFLFPGIAAAAAPVLTDVNNIANYVENDPPVIIDNNILVSDADSTDLNRATISITTNFSSAEDVLVYNPVTGITGAYSSTTGILTLSGIASLSAYEQALQGVRYQNSSENPSTATRTLSFVVRDTTNTSSTAKTTTLTITKVNDAPVISGVGNVSNYTENAAAVLIDSSVTITDVDNSNLNQATITITDNFTSPEDVLVYSTLNGITGSYNSTAGVLTLSGVATTAQYEQALESVQYRNSSDNPNAGIRRFLYVVRDNSNAESLPGTTTLTITPINDAPVISAVNNIANYTENDPAVIIDPAITITDLDNLQLLQATVSITGSFVSSEDILVYSPINGITGSYNSTTGVYTLSGTATLAQYKEALESVRYQNASDDPTVTTRTISFAIRDTANASSTAKSTTLTLTAVNDAPIIDVDNVANYTEGAAAVVIDSSISIQDPDNGNMNQAKVSIVANFSSAEDTLSYSTINGITGSYSSSTGVLTLSGVATTAQYCQALGSVRYKNSSTSPNTADRSISFIVRDNSNTNSIADITTLTITPVNSAPVISGVDNVANYTENGPSVIIDPAVTLSDLDSTQLNQAKISIIENLNSPEDVLVYSTLNGISGSYDNSSGILTLSNTATLAQYKQALESVKYQNSSENPNTGTRKISFVVRDTSDTSSSAVATTLAIAAVNDSPTISDIVNQTINEDGNTGSLSFTIGDAETATSALTVVASSTNTALVPNNSANLSLGGAGASRTLAVTPAANQSGTATITVTVSDGTLTASDTFTLTVNAVNDSPTITDIVNQMINEDGNTGILSFTVGDVETAAGSLTVTASSSNTTLVPNNSANLSLGGSGASRTLAVTPVANQSGTATITVTVFDGTLTASDTFDLTVNAVNDAPTISDIVNQTINHDTNTGSLGFTIGDVETPASSLSVTALSSNTALVPNNSANLTLGGSGASRTIVVTPAAGQSGTAAITVTVSDSSLSSSDTFILTVNGINNTPTISDIVNQTINEDTNTGSLGFTVGDAETAATSLTVTASSSNTTLVPNSSANLTLGGAGASRTILVTPAANKFGTATITVTVSDGSMSASDTFVVTVNSVNDKPTIANLSNLTISEDTTTNSFGFTISDVETAASSLTVTVTSSNTTLVPNTSANLMLGGSGGIRTLAVFPAANQSGTTTITVTVSDGSLSANASFVLTVNPVNDVPTISDIANQTIYVNTSTGSLGFTVGDVETAAGSLAVTATSSNTILVPNNSANLSLAGSAASRTIVVTPAMSQTGTATITVTVSDGAASGSDTFTITVTAVDPDGDGVNTIVDLCPNTPPGYVVDASGCSVPDAVNDNVSVNEDTSLVINALANDNGYSGILTLQSLTQPTNGSAIGANNSIIIYTPKLNFTGSDSFSYSIRNGNATPDTAVVTITVNPTNDPPVTLDQNLTVAKNTPVLVNVLEGATDAEGDTVVLQSISTAPVHGTAVINGQSVLYTPAQGYSGSDHFNFMANDGHGGTDTGAINIQIVDVDSDGDGILNTVDKCPNSPANQQVDGDGCTAAQLTSDADGDGIIDSFDTCQNTPQGTPIKQNGCALAQLDSDKDGISDALDQCPDSTSASGIGSNGCVPDVDFDGVANAQDQCPNTPRNEQADENGCSLSQFDDDNDGDGIPYATDNCPNTANIDQADSDLDGIGDACEVIGSITILQPTNNLHSKSNVIGVSGTFSGPSDSGVTVEGREACVSNGAFYANNIPLNEGLNVITAQIAPAVTGIGQSSSVNVGGLGDIRFTPNANHDCDVAPFETKFSFSGSSNIESVSADFDNDGTTDVSGNGLQTVFTHQYDHPGVYQAKFTGVDNNGNSHVRYLYIVAHDPSIANGVQQTWSSMISALSSANIAEAVNNISSGSQEKYQDIFQNLAPNMTSIVSGFSSLQVVEIHQNYVECAITRQIEGDTRVFMIYFVRENGVWKIDSM